MAILATSQQLLDTTLQRWQKGFDDQTTDLHPILAMIKAKGKINNKSSGKYVQKTQRNKQHQLEGYSDYEQMDFARQDLFENAKLGFRGLNMTGAISEMEAAQNEGPEALVRYFAGKLDLMQEDAEDQIGEIFYSDGSLAANSKKPHGVMSFLGYVQGDQNTTDAFATTPSDNYAELSTALGAYGGSGTNSGDVFKFDRQSPEWSAFTPTIVNSIYNPGGAARTWGTHADELLERAEIQANKSGKDKDSIDFFCVSRAKMIELRGLLRTKERILVDRGAPNSKLIAIGFNGIVNVGGIDVCVDSDVPALDGSGRELDSIGWNCNRLKLEILKAERGAKSKTKFWNHAGKWYDPNQGVYKFWLRNYMNMLCEPRYFAMIGALG